MIRPAFVPLPAVALADLLSRAADGCADLVTRGCLFDPDDPAGWTHPPADVLAEMAGLAAGCEMCRIGPSALGDHWLELQRQKYLRALPAWTCPCGAVYEVLRDAGQEFCELGDDAVRGPACAGAARPGSDEDCWHDFCAGIVSGRDCLLGARVGVIRTNARGKVTHSGACRACGRPFAGAAAPRVARPAPAPERVRQGRLF